MSNIIFNPQETNRLTIQNLEYRRDNKHLAIPFYLPDMDKHLNPLLPGDLVTIIGRPGNGKTGIMIRWARKRAEFLQEYKIENRVILYVTYEQYIEDLNSIQLAARNGTNVTSMARGELSDDDMNGLIGAAVKQAQLPIWYVGHSSSNRKERPNLTPDVLIDSFQKLERERGVQIDMVFVDYLQRMPLERRSDKVMGTMKNLTVLKDFGFALSCPFVAGVQAKREVDQRQNPIPGMDDGQWTSNIEQDSDKIITAVRPSKYRDDGDMFGKIVVNGHNQILLTLAKQKLGQDGQAVWAYFDPAYNKFDQMELKHYDTRKDID